MVQPRLSRYRNLWDAIPAEFKENITWVKRSQSGLDDYERPLFIEETETLLARIDILDTADRVPEEGGIREREQARVYLKIGEDLGLLQNIKIGPGGPCSGVGGQGLQYGDFYALIQTYDQEGEITAGGLQIQIPGPETIDFFLGQPDENHSRLTTLLSATEYTDIDYDGPGTYLVQIHWDAEKVQVFIDGELKITHTAQVPQTAAQVFYICPSGSSCPNPVLFVYAYIPGNEIQPTDRFRFRDKEWAILDNILTTHLQRELLVQEVIPNG